MPLCARRFAIVLAILAASRASADTATRPEVEVQYRDDRLSARLAAAPVRDVLAAIATATGADVRGQPIGGGPVSVEIDGASLDAALHRVLGSQNFTLSYGRDGRPRTIVLLGGPEIAAPRSERPTAAGVAVAPAGPTGPTGSAFPLTLSRAWMKARPVPVPEPLAEALAPTARRFPTSSTWPRPTTTASAAPRRHRPC